MNDSSGIQEARRLYRERMDAKDKAEAEALEVLDRMLERLTTVASIEDFLDIVRTCAVAGLAARKSYKAVDQAQDEINLRSVAE